MTVVIEQKERETLGSFIERARFAFKQARQQKWKADEAKVRNAIMTPEEAEARRVLRWKSANARRMEERLKKQQQNEK